MSILIAIEYGDLFKAEEIRLKLLKMQKNYLVDLARLRRGYQRHRQQGQTASGPHFNQLGLSILPRSGGYGALNTAFLFSPWNRVKVRLNT